MKNSPPGILRRLPDEGRLEIRLVSDASYSQQDRSGQLGGIIQLVPEGTPPDCTDNILGHWSSRCPTKQGSTAGVELAALRRNWQNFWRVVVTIRELYPDRTRLVFYGDNTASLQQAMTGAARSSPISNEDADYIKQEVKYVDGNFIIVPTKSMIADCLTKPIGIDGRALL